MIKKNSYKKIVLSTLVEQAREIPAKSEVILTSSRVFFIIIS